MSSARRSLLTATAAGTLLGALWFVPSATATPDTPARADFATTQVTQQARAVSAADTRTADGTGDGAAAGTGEQTGDGVRLADTGSFDTTPYVAAGAALLVVGAGFVGYSIRRERLDF
ncbi:LAETG motif-containing sortase-dependent surface protein [Streptomyces sp. NPDC056161]|uniref:LAETG motif-containing sortase-dependent surface protein n=1 Tax=Streptomyces sp. NPDC056161 TaxID=3345732 RepID=UPI0035D5AE63